MSMKRREFIKELSMIVAGLAFVPLLGNGNSDIFLTEDEMMKELKIFGQVILPKNPKMYSSLYFLNCCGSEDITLLSIGENINGQAHQKMILQKNRKYQVQYLGKFYGWSVI